MKQLFSLVFSFLSLIICAQQKNTHEIKIELEDAETGKNIINVKVTLEGFEIPPITAHYHQKGKYYYFDKIPAGYNTIMAYHKNYNEKGFQNTAGLPKELKMKLQFPYRIKIAGDSINSYKEDNYHICILFNDTLLNTLKTSSDFNSASLSFAKEYITKFYKNLVVVNELNIGFWGVKTIIASKKDKTKFKRFNDSTIEKLNGDKNILSLFTILMLTKNAEKTYFDENGTQNYIPKYIQYINCDSMTNNYQSSMSLATQSINLSEISQKENRNNSDSYIYRDYKEKLKSGLIKNNIYKRNKKEINALFISDQTRISNGELLDNFNNRDTISVSCQKLKPITSMPTLQNYLKQYIATSNILSYNDIHLIYKNDTFHYQISYSLHDIAAYKKESSLIESKKINKEIEIYSLKNNTASPLGTMDLIEYYNALGINVHQKIEKSINQ